MVYLISMLNYYMSKDNADDISDLLGYKTTAPQNRRHLPFQLFECYRVTKTTLYVLYDILLKEPKAITNFPLSPKHHSNFPNIFLDI